MFTIPVICDAATTLNITTLSIMTSCIMTLSKIIRNFYIKHETLRKATLPILWVSLMLSHIFIVTLSVF